MKTMSWVDLFCGAGGTSTGLIQASRKKGVKLELTAIKTARAICGQLPGLMLEKKRVAV